MSESVASNKPSGDHSPPKEVHYYDLHYRVFVPVVHGPILSAEDTLPGSVIASFNALFTDTEEEAAQLEASVALVGPDRPWQSKYNPRLLDFVLSLPTVLHKHPGERGDLITYDYLNGKGEPIVTGLLEEEAQDIIQKKYAELGSWWQHPAEEITAFFADKDCFVPLVVTTHGYVPVLT